MKKTIKWIVIAIVGLWLLAIGVPLALVMFIDPNDYKDEIIQAVHTHTGRELRIPGDMHWSLNWQFNLAVELGELVLGNAPGFGKEPFARIKNAAVAVDVLPLLSGEVKLGTVSLDGLFVNLQRDKQGRTNWQDLTAAKAESPAPKKPVEEKRPAEEPAPTAVFALGGLEISNAEIRWQDHQTNTAKTLKDFSLESGPILPGQVFPLQLGFTYDSSAPEFRLHTELTAKANFDPAAQLFVFNGIQSTQKFSGKAIPGDQLQTQLDIETLSANVAANHHQVIGAQLTSPGMILVTELDSKESAKQMEIRGNIELALNDGKAVAKSLGQSDMNLAIMNGTKLTVPIQGNLSEQVIRLHNIRLRGPLLNAESKLTITKAIDAPHVNGKLEIEPFSPRELMAQLQLPAPVTADNQVLQKASLQSQVTAKVLEDATSLALRDMKLQLDDTQMTGTFEIADISRQALRFKLNVDRLNADRYLPPESKDEKKPAKSTPSAGGKPGAGGQEEPLPVDLVRGLDIAGKLQVGALQLMQVKMSQVVARMVAKNDKLVIDPLKFQLYDGGYAGSAVIDASGKTATYVVKSNANQVNLGPLVKDLTGKQDLTGKGQVKFSLTARGNTISKIKQALNGTAGFALTKGTVSLIDTDALGKYLMAKVTKQPLPPKESVFRSSPYEQMSGSAKVVNGVINNNDLLVKSTNADVKGTGKVDIARETMDYKTTVIYGQSKDGKYKELEGLPLVVTLTGPFDNLKKDFDVDGFAKAWLKREAEQKLDKEKKKLEEKYKDKYKEKYEKKIEDKLKDIFR